MTAAVQAQLRATVVVLSFNPDPGTPPGRALQVLLVGRALPTAELGQRERFADAAQRAAVEAGLVLDGGRRGRRTQLHLVGLDDEPARNRVVVAQYYATVPFETPVLPGKWASVGRSPQLDGAARAAVKNALDELKAATRFLAGSAALLGDVFTGEDLLRVQVALHGGPQGSDRTFRRRVQELRDSGVLRPVRAAEVAGLRQRVGRFRSPQGTGGRPPELLRYSGAGGEEEPLVSLRARRRT